MSMSFVTSPLLAFAAHLRCWLTLRTWFAALLRCGLTRDGASFTCPRPVTRPDGKGRVVERSGRTELGLGS